MRPLSPVLYFRRNLLRTLPVLGIIALAVVGVLVVGVLAESQIESPKTNWIEPARLYARIMPRKNALDPNLGATLRAHPDVERVVPVYLASVRVIGMMGSNDAPVPGLAEQDMDWYMNAVGERLVEGRLPQGSKREIALHSALLKSKGLGIGDMIGRDVDPQEWLPGKFQVVGVLDGPVQMGVVTAPAMREATGQRQIWDVFAKPGRMEALDAYLRTFNGETLDVRTLTVQLEAFERETAFVGPILLAINGVTVVVLSLAVGLLNQIYFLQRIPEYGILLAMGYRVGQMIRRTLVEALTLTITGWVLGLGLATLLNWALRISFFDPSGMTLSGISPKLAATTLPIPILIAGFSLITVIRRLRGMDPVSIVERRD